jgi:hypothetical protein
MNNSELRYFRTVEDKNAHFPRGIAHVPDDIENRMLRQALRQNLVSFPAQVPVFERQSRPDLQQRLVTLYFVRGWTMDEIAGHYGLARQRIGQILTAWRIRATKEGYIQEIEPEHPLFQRIRQEQADQFAEVPVSATSPLGSIVAESPKMVNAPIAASIIRASEVAEAPIWRPVVRELRASNVAEELQAIVCVLDNQLGLCAKPLHGNIDSCEQLLARANTLCARLEAQLADTNNNSNDGWPTIAIISAAKALFKRFQEYTAERSRLPFQPVFASAGRMSHTTRSTG